MAEKKQNPVTETENGKSKNKTSKKVVVGTTIGCLAIIVIVIVLIVVYIASLFGSIGQNVNTPSWPTVSDNESISDYSLPVLEPISDEYFNILLIGVDSRTESMNGNTDSMILLSLDNRHKKLKMVSLMRDSWVTIPGYKEGRLNAAYAVGGPQLLMDTIEYNYNFKIDHYAIVNFEMFVKVVDTIGGVTIDLTKEEVDHLNDAYSNQFAGLHVGSNEFDGQEALAYSRIRHLEGGDFERTQRQRNVIHAIVDGAKDSDIFTILNLVEEVLPFIQTNVSSGEVFSLAGNAMSYLSYDLTELRVPVDGTWHYEVHGTASTVDYDCAENGEKINEFIYEDVYTPSSETSSSEE